MAVSLYPHQLEAIRNLKTGSILLGGVGSGKSITSIAYYFTKVCGGRLDFKPVAGKKIVQRIVPLFIITTARKRDTGEWDNQCARFMLSRERDNSLYHIPVVIDSWNNIQKYENEENAFFIFDEQRVVGYGTWTKTFIRISRHNDWILLTATPGDTWSDYIPVFIANHFYRNKTDFNNEHVIFKRFSKFPQIDRYVNTKLLEKHRADICVEMPFDRPTLPHHDEVIVNYDRKLSDYIMKQRWDPYKNEPIADAGSLCYVLRKACNSDDSRLEAIKDILVQHPKCIIFYNFNYELDILRQLDTTIAEWNGQKHEPIPTGDSWVYLVQYTAGAEGWNCITTDTIIFYSQSYSYKAMTQAAGRIDRMNTPFKDLYYYHLISRSKIDMSIRRALKNKKNFNESGFFKKL